MPSLPLTHVQTSSTHSDLFIEPDTETLERAGQEIWDDILASPESDALLTLLVEQARHEESRGNFDEGDW